MAVLIISESGAFGGLARLADGDERGLIEVIACNGGDHAAGDGDSARKVTGIDVQRDRHFFSLLLFLTISCWLRLFHELLTIH